MKKITIIGSFILFSISIVGQVPKSTVEGNNKFAFELFHKLKPDRHSKNLIFSPFSVSSVLAMTYAGARNETQSEMSRTLHFSLKQNNVNSDFDTLLKKITINRGSVQLTIANSLWAQKDSKFLDSYFNLIKSYYKAELQNVDFVNSDEREKTRLMINKWVENKTNNKIKDIMKPGILDDYSSLVLVNAIYFSGKWAIPFNRENTLRDTFHLTAKKSIETPFMKNTLKLKYFENDKLQSVEIPYMGNKITMIIVLPKIKTGVEELDKSITYISYKQMLDSMKNETVELTMPKFQMTSYFQLEHILKNMGMKISFSENADFSGMTGDSTLSIDRVIHKAFIDISEEGNEIPPSKVVAMGPSASPQNRQAKTFLADHPFLFLIKDEETGSILFMGKINKPELK